MVRQKYFPNYINNYYYTKGSKFIKLQRSDGKNIIYNHTMYFDTPEEAEKYFNSECGA